jgi:4-hydroxyphenylpyruvate dioxygenase-like putative hemolysin
MRMAQMLLSTGRGCDGSPASWAAVTSLTGPTVRVQDSADESGYGARALSLAIDGAPDDRVPDDFRLHFDGGFELELRASPAPGDGMPIDHVTVCVYPENLAAYAEKIAARLPSARCERYDAGTGLSGMSIAAISLANGFRIVLAAPTGESGQVAEFLARTGCEGLQHVAFSVPEMGAAYAALAEGGVTFLGGSGEEAVVELRDEDRWLRQAFTAPLWGEFFIEILERHGIEGLHPGNMQSLYEMNERPAISDAPALRAAG